MVLRQLQAIVTHLPPAMPANTNLSVCYVRSISIFQIISQDSSYEKSEKHLCDYSASMVEMPMVTSSSTSSSTFTVSREVSMVMLFWLAVRRMATPSS